MMDVVTKYRKAAVAAFGVILSAILAALTGDNVINPNEWANVVILGSAAMSVAIAPNVPGARYTKTLLAAIHAGATVLVSVMFGGLTTPEMIQIVIAAGVAAGVFKVPNKGDLYGRMY